MKTKTFRAQNYFEPRNNQRIDGLSEMEQQILFRIGYLWRIVSNDFK